MRKSLLFVLLLGATQLPLLSLQESDSDPFAQLKYRHIGPLGNRVSAVVGVPGNPNLYYIGAASGGIFKSEDAGAHWKPVFDDQPVASIGSLAVAPSDPNLVWAGTGETFIRSNVSLGNGIYRSTDAGKSFKHMGLEKTGRIGRVVIHPTNPDLVYAAALGHCYGPQPERGVYRSRDGGTSWEQVLFVDQDTGAVDLVMDPNNPRILFAASWQMQIQTWGRSSGGPGSGLHVSRDGGDSWEKLEGKGLPKPPWGKIGLAMTPRDSNRVYALIETNSNREFEELKEHQGVLWRSDDGGRRWRKVSSNHTLAQRPLYYTRAVAAPDDADEIHFMSTVHTRSLDGGKTVKRLRSGGDHHDMWIDPLMPDRMMVGHDQGVSISVNRGKSWFRPQLPIAQMYHVYTDNQIPYFVYGNRQDGPSTRGPSNTLTRGSIPIGAWHSVGGCESGFAIPDPVDNHIVWSGCYEGILDRYDLRTGHVRNVSVWPDNPEGWAAGDLKYRFQWTFPVTVSPHDHNRVYAGSQHVHQTSDGGQSWTVISGDLTTNDKDKQQKTGGLTPDDVSPTYAAVLFAIAESPLEEGLIWAGSNDGLLHLTRNGGQDWANLTPNIPDLPPWGTVSNIEPSPHQSSKAYITVDFHQLNNTDPFVYKTEDYGQTWTAISSGIPPSTHSYAHCVREDPLRPGLLYLGTENALYVSFDEGGSWQPLQSNLPHAPVHWLTVQEHFNDLVVATYGRGFWILDDLSALQQLNDEVRQADIHLFAPRAAYRFLSKQAPNSQPGDPAAGKNPQYGASIQYWLKEEQQEPQEKIRIEILDEQGRLIRSLPDEDEGQDEGQNEGEGESSRSKALPAKAGINRAYWDLRHERSRLPKLRTRPLEHSHLEMPEKGWRSLGEGGRVAPLAVPATYTVRLLVGDQEFTQPLEVRKDPSSAGSLADIQAQVERVLQIRNEVDGLVGMIHQIEWLRRQLYDLKEILKGRDGIEDILHSADDLDALLIELESRFFDLRLTGGLSRQDTLRWPRRLYAKLTSLAGYISRADFPPNSQQIEVHEFYRQQIADSRQRLEELLEEVSAFNRMLRQRGLAGILEAGE